MSNGFLYIVSSYHAVIEIGKGKLQMSVLCWCAKQDVCFELMNEIMFIDLIFMHIA